MKILNVLLTSLLGVLFLAPVAAAQDPVQLADEYFKGIRAERVDTLADMEAIFDQGTARMKLLAKEGESRLEIRQVALRTMRALDRRAKRGAQVVLGIEEEGVTVLEQVLAPPYLIKRLHGASSRALDAVVVRHRELWIATQSLLAKLT